MQCSRQRGTYCLRVFDNRVGIVAIDCRGYVVDVVWLSPQRESRDVRAKTRLVN